ncbi:hypothetical protein Bbelb_335760 [Branchiostoma belcheri]|nr:hypothetical protein Bbelb_335760 [Branchiostoma belcheri]
MSVPIAKTHTISHGENRKTYSRQLGIKAHSSAARSVSTRARGSASFSLRYRRTFKASFSRHDHTVAVREKSVPPEILTSRPLRARDDTRGALPSHPLVLIAPVGCPVSGAISNESARYQTQMGEGYGLNHMNQMQGQTDKAKYPDVSQSSLPAVSSFVSTPYPGPPPPQTMAYMPYHQSPTTVGPTTGWQQPRFPSPGAPVTTSEGGISIPAPLPFKPVTAAQTGLEDTKPHNPTSKVGPPTSDIPSASSS